jgi:hypothetical protein
MQKGLLRPGNGLVIIWWRVIFGLFAFPASFINMYFPAEIVLFTATVLLLNNWNLIQPRIHPRVEWFFAGLLQPMSDGSFR